MFSQSTGKGLTRGIQHLDQMQEVNSKVGDDPTFYVMGFSLLFFETVSHCCLGWPGALELFAILLQRWACRHEPPYPGGTSIFLPVSLPTLFTSLDFYLSPFKMPSTMSGAKDKGHARHMPCLPELAGAGSSGCSANVMGTMLVDCY